MEFLNRMESQIEDLAATIVIVSLIAMLVIFVVAVLSYVLNAVALMKLGNRRGIKCSWLAWLPFGNSYVTGKIADEYEARNGIKRRWVAWLLSLDIVAVIVTIWQNVFTTNWQNKLDFPKMPTDLNDLEALESEVTNFLKALEDNLEVLFGGFTVLIGIAIVTGIISLLQTSLRMVCIYKIYESSAPKKSVFYLVLSLFVPLAESICLMACRNKGYECVPEMPMYNQEAPTYTEVPEQPTNSEQ